MKEGDINDLAISFDIFGTVLVQLKAIAPLNELVVTLHHPPSSWLYLNRTPIRQTHWSVRFPTPGVVPFPLCPHSEID